MKILYRLYQLFVALPILLVVTLSAAVLTILFCPWPNTEWLHKVQQFWARCFCWLLFIPVEIQGLENIQPGQSYVFVSNHQSSFDIFVIYGWLPVIFKWLMKQELRHIPVVGFACKAAGHIFIDRRNPVAAMESIQQVEKTLVNGISTVIFPEGTRSLNGQVGRFKRGAFQVALDVHLPILPISLTGCYQVMPKGALWVKRHPIRMTVGQPIMPPKETDDINGFIETIRQTVIQGC